MKLRYAMQWYTMSTGSPVYVYFLEEILGGHKFESVSPVFQNNYELLIAIRKNATTHPPLVLETQCANSFV